MLLVAGNPVTLEEMRNIVKIYLQFQAMPQNRGFEEHLCLSKHGSPLYSGLPSKTVA